MERNIFVVIISRILVQAKILIYHVKDCFKVNANQMIKTPKKMNKLNSNITDKNGKQNPDVSYTNIYQKHVACSYGYKLVCVDDTFSKPF